MLKVLLVGGTGLIGQYLAKYLSSKYDIYILSRQNRSDTDKIKYLNWNLEEETIDPLALNCEVIINLAGENIAAKRWTKNRKKKLIDSRVQPLTFLEKQLLRSGKKPNLFVSASAIGYYGNQGNKSLTENSPNGRGFLSDCTLPWENAATAAFTTAHRSAILRIGIVLSTEGGALPELMMTSKMGFLSYFGDMYYSWIHIHDIFGIVARIIEDSSYEGVLNAVSPMPIENKIMIQALAESLGGKIIVPAPQFAIKTILGERSDVVLHSTRVYPTRLIELGYKFHFPELKMALEHLLTK